MAVRLCIISDIKPNNKDNDNEHQDNEHQPNDNHVEWEPIPVEWGEKQQAHLIEWITAELRTKQNINPLKSTSEWLNDLGQWTALLESPLETLAWASVFLFKGVRFSPSDLTT